MSVVGNWSEQEIRASYTPSDAAMIGCIIALALVLTGIAFWRGGRRKELLFAAAIAVVCAAGYVLFVQEVARALCVDSPLYVKVHGLVKIPFFLATQDVGIFLVIVIFGALNFLSLRFIPQYIPRIMVPILVNVCTAGVLASTAVVAYFAASLGVGVPVA